MPGLNMPIHEEATTVSESAMTKEPANTPASNPLKTTPTTSYQLPRRQVEKEGGGSENDTCR